MEESSSQIIDNSYDVIASFYEKTLAIEEEAKMLNNLETLFDM